jgi:hypothetical protein
MKLKLFGILFSSLFAAATAAQAESSMLVCKRSADCVMLDNPRCEDTYNKLAVNKKSKKLIAKRKCKRTKYQFNSTDAGFEMKVDCVQNVCTLSYTPAAG